MTTSTACSMSTRPAFEGDYGLTAADIAAGTVHNEATASAEGPQAQPVSDDASADTTLPPPPPATLMTLDKSDAQGTHFVDSNENGSADTGDGTSGDLIQFIIRLENVGGVALTDVVVDDPLLGGPLGLPDGGDANASSTRARSGAGRGTTSSPRPMPRR
jgi:large repetitive protein